MKNVGSAIVIFLLSWISVGAAQAQNPPGQNIKRDLEVLDFIRKTIGEKYYDKNYRGVDLDAQFKSYAEKLMRSRSDQESLTLVAAAMKSIAAELRAQYALGIKLDGTQRKEGRHKIDVRLSPQHDTLGKAIKLSVRAREGYR